MKQVYKIVNTIRQIPKIKSIIGVKRLEGTISVIVDTGDVCKGEVPYG